MKRVRVNNSLQKNYSYTLTEPVGKNFHPDFKPELTPKQMFSLGIFCGVYFHEAQKEFPQSWFPKKKVVSPKEKDCSINYFKVDASQTLAHWKKKGWIHKDDPYGWVQWYCRYYMGRRHKDDTRQIKRWKAFRRHAGAVAVNCKRKDMVCRPVQRQALLHWAYDSRKI